jgi:hypothetical protein
MDPEEAIPLFRGPGTSQWLHRSLMQPQSHISKSLLKEAMPSRDAAAHHCVEASPSVGLAEVA